MEKRTIGKSGIEVSAMAMGAWAIGGGITWGENDDEESIRSIHCALDSGITWIDTAPAYGLGHSEEVVGRALKGRRDKVVVSTKCGLQWYDGEGTLHMKRDGAVIMRNLSPKSIRRDLEKSLKRLDTDYIDVYYTHWQSVEPFFIPVQETMAELMKMKQEGKIRAIGASNVTVDHMKEYLKYGQLDVIQEKFSMVDRKAEIELLPFCEENGLTLQAYSPIEQGLLTGKVGLDYKIRPGEVRDNKKWWKPENHKLVLEMFEGWGDLTKKYQASIGNLVIAWTMARSKNLNVLCGARKIPQVQENVKAAEITLEKADFDRMTADADAIIAKSVD